MPTFKGAVTCVHVFSNGEGSAMLQFTLSPPAPAPPQTFQMVNYPDTMPQAFSAAAALLSAAYFHPGEQVTATYREGSNVAVAVTLE